MASYAHVFGLPEKVEKANPYHDAQGRFSTADGAKFVSTGARFSPALAKLRARMQASAPTEAPSFAGVAPDSSLAAKALSTKLGADTASMYDKLTDDEKAMVKKYTGSAHGDLNRGLGGAKGKIEGLDSDFVANVGLLDKSMTKMSLPEDVVLYRALDIGLNGLQGFTSGSSVDELKSLVGQVYEDHAFSSSSLNPQVAAGFSSYNKIMVEIKARKGSKGVFVGGHYNEYDTVDFNHPHSNRSRYPEEQEVILPRGSKFAITGARSKLFAQDSGYQDTYTLLQVELID